jgi:serine/threonine-protein kinase
VLGRQLMSTSPAGAIATLGPLDAVGQFTWIGRDGRTLDRIGVPEKQLGVELSPDRRQLATVRANEVWTMELARPVPVRSSPFQHRHPVWSPDGRQLLLMNQGRGTGAFDLVAVTPVAGGSTTIQQASNVIKPVAWQADGRVAWIGAGPIGRSEATIWTQSAGGKPERVVHDADSFIFEARVSPNGQWVAYSTNRSGRFEVEVSSFPESGRRYPVSTEGGGFPRWRADSRELYFLSPDSRLMATSFTGGTHPAIGTPVPLFEVQLVAHPDRGTFAEYEYDVNADGSQFLINRLISPPDHTMTVIINWNAGAPAPR